jgi:hypothetical protein
MRTHHITEHAAVLLIGICLAVVTLAGSLPPMSPLRALLALAHGLPGVP